MQGGWGEVRDRLSGTWYSKRLQCRLGRAGRVTPRCTRYLQKKEGEKEVSRAQ
jgi:hypothetical protein